MSGLSSLCTIQSTPEAARVGKLVLYSAFHFLSKPAFNVLIAWWLSWEEGYSKMFRHTPEQAFKSWQKNTVASHWCRVYAPEIGSGLRERISHNMACQRQDSIMRESSLRKSEEGRRMTTLQTQSSGASSSLSLSLSSVCKAAFSISSKPHPTDCLSILTSAKLFPSCSNISSLTRKSQTGRNRFRSVEKVAYSASAWIQTQKSSTQILL